MSHAGEALVLCLYAGGHHRNGPQRRISGFAPYPSFLTETFRSQSRFHDPQPTLSFLGPIPSIDTRLGVKHKLGPAQVPLRLCTRMELRR